MKYLAQDILQAVSDLQDACLSSVTLQSHVKGLVLVDGVHDEQFHHLHTVLFSPKFLLQFFESCYP